MIVFLYNRDRQYIDKYIKLEYLPRIGESIRFSHNNFDISRKIIDIIHNENSTIDLVLDYGGV